jgi:signal transduction histidine kinase
MSRWEEPPVGPGVFTLIFLAIATTLMVGWTTFVITRPLRRFAAAVENFRDMRNDDVIVEDGPAEIRAAIAAFNRMRTRIGKLMADRTAMLAAVSHDLRTPITRLRLRAEFIEDAGQRGPFLADLDHMADLTQAALRHLSTAESRDPYEATDLPSLMQTIADQYGDMGHDVAYAGPERFTARVRLRDMQRAITNLVDNAIRFGQHVALSLETVSGTRLDIVVADDGPGIPPEERRRLIEPFQRGNSARTSESGAGFGLGLAIARDIAEAHGGELRLEDNTPQGLRAVISIAVK